MKKDSAMQQLKNILVAHDFSEPSDAALTQAIRLGNAVAAEVTVLHAVQSLLCSRGWLDAEADALLPTLGQLVEGAEERMRRALSAHQAVCVTRQEVVAGHACGTILEWCEKRRPDLLVLGAHSMADAYRNMGYTAATAIRKATAPVLAVHQSGGGPFRRILIATDFSETSRLALSHGLRLADIDGASVEILHVHADPWGHGAEPEWHRRALPDFADQYAGRVCETSRNWAAATLNEFPSVRVEHVALRHKSPGQGIVERAAAINADLIAIGTKGSTNLRYIFLGSTAERILRGVPCSVLAVKPNVSEHPLAADETPAPSPMQWLV